MNFTAPNQRLLIRKEVSAERNAADSVIVRVVRVSTRRNRVCLILYNIGILNRDFHVLCNPLGATGSTRAAIDFLPTEMVGILIRAHIVVAVDVNPAIRARGCFFLGGGSIRIARSARAGNAQGKGSGARNARNAHEHRDDQNHSQHFLHDMFLLTRARSLRNSCDYGILLLISVNTSSFDGDSPSALFAGIIFRIHVSGGPTESPP